MASTMRMAAFCPSSCQPATWGLHSESPYSSSFSGGTAVSSPPSGHRRQRWKLVACHVGGDQTDDKQAGANVAEAGSKGNAGRLSKQQLHVAANYVTRRSLASYIAASALVVLTANQNAESAKAQGATLEATQLELVPYTDEKDGFVLLRPAAWTKVDKAGATVLFEDPAKKSSTIGVVVNPVRIPSLREFGSIEAVAEKLLAAERKKESTKAATLIRTSAREAVGGVPLYTMEYTLRSTRGNKRTLTAVTIAANKLYILNIAYADSETEPAVPSLADPLHQVLDSFNLVA